MKIQKKKSEYNDTDMLRLWLFGKSITIEVPNPDPNKLEIYNPPELLWSFAPTGDYYSFTLNIMSAPNILHRIMQRVFFGIKYKLAK